MKADNIIVSMKAVADAFNAAMDQAAQSIQRFAESVDRSIKESETGLAQRFADRQGSPIKTVEWIPQADHIMWVVTLANRRKLVGLGTGRLDALADADRMLAEYPVPTR